MALTGETPIADEQARRTETERRKSEVIMVDAEHVYAVLTGDLVKSSRLTAEQSRSAMDRIRELAKEFEGANRGATIGLVDTFRHDSWQWLLAEPILGLRAAVFMRAGLRVLSDGKTKFDTRIAIGIGTAETISKRRISDSRGLAFTLSGKALDAMKDGRLAYASADESASAEGWLSDGIAPLLDCIVTDWTAAEARAVHGALLGLTQEQTAERWPVVETTGKRPTRQAINKTLTRAHWATVDGALTWLEKSKRQPPEVALANSNLYGLRPGKASPGAFSGKGGGAET
jgi:hypothetical protein